MGDFVTTTVIGAVKAIVYLYDFVSLPVYFLLQHPWTKWKKQTVWAKFEKEADPSSSIVRNSTENKSLLANISTVDELFQFAVQRYSTAKGFGVREVFGEEEEKQKDGKIFKKLILGDYTWYTYNDIDKMVENFSKGLLTLGLESRQNAVILAETRLEWFVAAQACFRIAVPVVTLYATLGEEGIVHAINETGASLLITSQELIPKIQKAFSQLLSIKKVIFMEGHRKPRLEAFPESVQPLSFSEVKSMGENSEKALNYDTPAPEDVAIIMYTSGSTGTPKGVMISHKNIITTCNGFMKLTEDMRPDDLYIAYLPLAHVLEIAAESFFLAVGVPLGYSSPLTMTDKSTAVKKGCKGDATILKPTLMSAVPLILDRIQKAITEAVQKEGKLSEAFFEFALEYKHCWKTRGFQTPIMNWLLFKKIKNMVGGRLRAIASGGAPLSSGTQEFIRTCLDVYLIQGYGLTETTAAATIMDLQDMSSGRVGAPVSDCFIQLKDWEEGGYSINDKPHPRGEIFVGGGSVTLGYYRNEELTKEAFFEKDGIRWFCTGDIGEMYPDGTIKIIDRKKDFVKLQFGEYISLGKVESELKRHPLVDNICVYGDSFKSYVVALVVPNQRQLHHLARSLGIEDISFEDMCMNKAIVAEVLKSLAEEGKKAKLQKMEIPQKIKLCFEQWSPDSGLVTATYKLRRKAVQDYYRDELADLYS
ncbi:long-chain-fatty-acid--CoA ligase 4-like [Limulus polyphemus]|uniref:long-chain-fatty-acid--CoA ligase n=1 Tax=Limulus polyphemus TaxID=6850 RepID=A0ABM1RWW0_LIMPO|nr:long-chain-fatty-acid--CoA ligase 4-like [Limulus polyphemus]XP_022235869.1 long-chain-fatty-acid--CoA ligase 4-like [Limulus polyphemus]